MVIFHSYVNVYQRLIWHRLGKKSVNSTMDTSCIGLKVGIGMVFMTPTLTMSLGSLAVDENLDHVLVNSDFIYIQLLICY